MSPVDYIHESLATEVILGHRRRPRRLPGDTTSGVTRRLSGVDVHILRAAQVAEPQISYSRKHRDPPVTNSADLTADQQTAMLADRYTERAELYDTLWSPVIRPVGERLVARLPLSSSTRNVVDIGTGAGALLPAIQRAAPSAVVVGIDRSAGMLRLAKKNHANPLVLMDVQKLALSANRFEVAVVAFVLFHLPYPEKCLAEVNRVLKPGGTVGTVTWGSENMPPANAIWEDELEAAGAQIFDLPAVDNRACCDGTEKMTALLERAGFVSIKVRSESIQHRWRPEDHFDYQLGSASRLRLQSLDIEDREACLRRLRDRLSGAGEKQYVYRGELFVATAVKADHPARARRST